MKTDQGRNLRCKPLSPQGLQRQNLPDAVLLIDWLLWLPDSVQLFHQLLICMQLDYAAFWRISRFAVCEYRMSESSIAVCAVAPD